MALSAWRASSLRPALPQRAVLDEFLSDVPADIQRLADELRVRVKETVPNGKEVVYTGWKLIGYRAKAGKRDAYFCFIAPFEHRVMPGSEYGVPRFDPNPWLEGNGTQVRYLTVREQSERHTHFQN